MNGEPMFTRREFVIRSATLAAAAAIGSSLVAACAPGSPAASGSGSTKSAASQRVRLPSLLPVQGAKPDLPGTDIIPDGFTVYPKERFKAVPTPPGKGGDVTLVSTISNPMAPLESNTLWQGVNKALNVNLKLNLVPFA